MQVTRRSAIKHLFIISAGAALLPSCVNDKKEAASKYANLSFSAKDEEVLAAVAETIIPTTDTPGAKEVGAKDFMLLMVNDCYTKDEQQRVMKGFAAFNESVKKQHGKAFAQLDESTRVSALKTALEEKDTDMKYFVQTMKRYVTQAYTQSEYYLTKVDSYKLIPGKFISSAKV